MECVGKRGISTGGVGGVYGLVCKDWGVVEKGYCFILLSIGKCIGKRERERETAFFF